ncbi:MerR family DNA-binding transcriptional regulator, partial [Patescibacteria group bacterium]|nr:MerR family DNA-binding transcriptional regulator [Patescibacteria group bacterium]
MSLSTRSLFTIIQAAEILGVSPKTIRRLKSKGIVSPQRGSNRQILLSIKDLDILRNVLKKPLDSKTYSVADTAKILGVSKDTIRRWEKEEKLESIRTTGGHRRFATEAIRGVKEKKYQPQTKITIPPQEIIKVIDYPFPSSPPFSSEHYIFNLKMISFMVLSTLLITIAMGPAFIASKLTLLQHGINQLQTQLTQITREEEGYPVGNLAAVLSSSEGVYEGDVQIVGQVLITGQSIFEEYVKFKKGAEFGSSPLIIDSVGNLTTDQNITTESLVVEGDISLSRLSVAGNEIINSSGKIPAINNLYFESLSGKSLTDVDAHHLNGVAASSFLRSDQVDTAEATINFTASPGSTNVNGGPVYINPAASTSNYTLFGIALGGSQRFKVDAEGDIVASGDIQISSAGKQFKLSTNTSDPTALGSGSLYFNTSSSKLRVYTGSSWSDISGDMTGSGTANYLTKWTASNTLGDSVIQESSGQIGIGISPSQTLDVNGDIRIRGGEIYLDGLSTSSSTTDGTIYFDTDDNNLYLYANSAFNKVGSDLTKYTANNASLADGGYLEVAHNEGTNDIMISGWIYDGSKYIEIDDHAQTTLNIQDPNLIGWYKMEEASGDLDNAEGTAPRDLIDKGTPTYAQTGHINSAISLDGTSDYFCTGTDTTCADNNDFDFGSSSFSIGGWFKHDTISTNSDYIAVKYSDTASVDSGDGDDGAITVSVNTNINTTDLISARSCTEGGDAVNYNVSALTSTTATLTSTPSAGCLAIGDEVLLINLQGGTSAYSNVGNYETLRIQSIAGAVVTFTTSKLNYYGDGASDDTNLGTAIGTQRVMLQRVPNYTSVTVNDAINFYPDDYAGSKGGVMFFRATGAVAINGTGKIHADAKGYRAGIEGSGNFLGGGGGEAFCGPTGTAGGDGGDYNARDGGNGSCGGGGGSGVDDTAQGTPGTGSASAGGAGGGGGAAEDGNSTGNGYGGGGAGGGYGTIGYKGTNYNSGGTPGDGGTNNSGDGGKGYGSVDNQYGGMGGGGGTYGDVNLTDLFFGSGGGAGGDGDSYVDGSLEGGNGGDGGGIVYIAADSITVNGFLSNNGGNGSVGESRGGGGGGGAGGSLKLISDTINLGTSKVTATGGTGGNTSYADGGAGGDGRIHADYVTSTSGDSDPVYDSSQVSASAGGYKLYMESDGDITFAIDDDQNSFPEDSTTTTPANYDDNSWHHLAVVKSGSSYIKIYIDGLEMAADYSIAANTSISNDDPFYLGVDSDGSSNPWQGLLDEMFVLSRDLSAGEVGEL